MKRDWNELHVRMMSSTDYIENKIMSKGIHQAS
jgi:hypothetical protein